MKAVTIIIFIIAMVFFGFCALLPSMAQQPIGNAVQITPTMTAQKLDPNTVEIATIARHQRNRADLLTERRNHQNQIQLLQERIAEIDLILGVLE